MGIDTRDCSGKELRRAFLATRLVVKVSGRDLDVDLIPSGGLARGRPSPDETAVSAHDDRISVAGPPSSPISGPASTTNSWLQRIG